MFQERQVSGFAGKQRTFTFTQTNSASIDKVFPLLCPVRETEWLDGWSARIIYSQSGYIEKNCVFATPHTDGQETIWLVTQYDPQKYLIEFVRLTPGENIVRINIELIAADADATLTTIRYQYTGLSEAQNEFIASGLEASFRSAMLWWERAINHFLETGNKLLKTNPVKP